jgi:hypothetical protein
MPLAIVNITRVPIFIVVIVIVWMIAGGLIRKNRGQR